MIDSILKFKYILLIFSSLLFVSCKKTINCPGFPEGLKNYFPNTSLLKFTNANNDTLKIAIIGSDISVPRTVSNNPLSEGGSGGDPFCIEELSYFSNYYNTFTNELEFSINITFYNESKYTYLRFNVTEPFVSTSGFEIDTTNTTTPYGKVFGDTLNLNSSFGRFNFAQLIYGQGIVKLYDLVNNCEWNRVF
jgi:hypothetical protein